VDRNLLGPGVRLLWAVFRLALRFEFASCQARGHCPLRVDCLAESNRIAGEKRSLVFLAEASTVQGRVRGLTERRH
jgi:hypothetical protein